VTPVGPVFGVWRPVEPKLLRRVHDRLSRTGGCDTVWYEPSRRDANEVVAEMNPTAFLEREYSALSARLRVEFDIGGERPHYWIQWWEPETARGLGWHADETEPEYGPVHLQLQYADGTTERRAAEHVADEHPYRTFERRLTSIPDRVAQLGWD
jgi:hypothetical protein